MAFTPRTFLLAMLQDCNPVQPLAILSCTRTAKIRALLPGCQHGHCRFAGHPRLSRSGASQEPVSNPHNYLLCAISTLQRDFMLVEMLQ